MSIFRRAFIAHPELVFRAELSLACTYAGRGLKSRAANKLAKDCAQHALDAAIQLQRPDLAFTANSLLGAL